MYLTEIFDFFLPRFCPVCDIKLNPEDKFVCPSCLNRIQYATKKRIQNEFERKYSHKNIISDFTSLYVFEKDKELQIVIHKLKYNQRFLLGKFLGEMIAINKHQEISSWNLDFTIPVPLHHLKKVERGYNQSFYIAKGIAKHLGLKVNVNAVKRKKYTLSQTKMNMQEREENMNGAFTVKNAKCVRGKNILLVDDVITTGATTNECGKVLIQAGAAKIFAVSAAIAE